MNYSKFLLPATILSFVILNSCGSGSAEVPKDTTKTAEVKDSEKIEVANSSPYAKGEEVYNSTCKACHQANGEGIPAAFPPLAKSDYLNADKARSIKQIIHGSSGEITVNGNKFNGAMPPQELSDDQIADVLNYVLHSWGNSGETVTPEEVKAAR